MNVDTIFNDGLDEVLCIIRDLPSYTASKLKQEDFKIARYEIDNILFKFQEYIKGLPAPDVSLCASSRVLIYNARNILEGISIVFNVQINYIQRLYSNYLKYKERQLVPIPYDRADIMKPKKKSGKTKKLVPVLTVIETLDSEVPMTRDAPLDTSFFDAAEPVPPSAVDGAALFERDSLLLSSLGDAAPIHPEDLELRFAESLKDVTTHLPSVSVPDIGQQDMSLPIHAQPYQVMDKSSLRLVEHAVDMDFSAAPRTVDKPSVEPLQLELEKIIANIGVDLKEVKTRNKNVKYKFRINPIMSAEEYTKFLERTKALKDPVKYYAKSIQKFNAEEQKEKNIEDDYVNPVLRDLLRMTVKEIPVPIIPLYLRDQPLAQAEPGKIPLFEFPITEDDVYRHEALQERTDEDAPQERRADADVLRIDLERPSEIMSSADLHLVDAVRPASEIDEIRNLSLLMRALSLDYTPRTSMVIVM
ncbi:unnamed protein product [Nezara viridula]|uniref:Uncharacterized protein n=1 Tax=Nezara viridula TaxID=85310 RepID=A0A9P0HPD9_NEZVI|nr:unnamed protein product [Nezara viridula]